MLTNVSHKEALEQGAKADSFQFCGEEGENCLLSGAVVCSNPFNLELSNTLLSGQYLGTKYLNMVKGTE